MSPRTITISEVEQEADASFTQTPMMAKMKLANSIQSDCIEDYSAIWLRYHSWKCCMPSSIGD